MYVTKYEEYPIYEPAEGGYYYAGERFTEAAKVKAGKGTRAIRQLYRELKEEWPEGAERVWITTDCRECGAASRYVGSGIRYVLEGNRRVGKKEHGWKPYC